MPRFDLFLVVAGYTPEDEIESNELDAPSRRDDKHHKHTEGD